MILGEESVTLVYPKGNPFGIHKEMTLEELSNLPTILFEKEDHLYHSWCRRKFNKVPKKVNVKYVVNSHGNMLHAVQEGIGIAVVPNHVLHRSFYHDKIDTLGKEFEVENGKFFVVYHKDSTELIRIKSTLERLTQEKNPFL